MSAALVSEDRLERRLVRRRSRPSGARRVVREPAADVLGLEVDLAALERGGRHLPAAEADARAVDGVAVRLEHLGVDLGHDLGFIEAVRADLDRRLAAPTRRAGAQRAPASTPRGQACGTTAWVFLLLTHRAWAARTGGPYHGFRDRPVSGISGRVGLVNPCQPVCAGGAGRSAGVSPRSAAPSRSWPQAAARRRPAGGSRRAAPISERQAGDEDDAAEEHRRRRSGRCPRRGSGPARPAEDRPEGRRRDDLDGGRPDAGR